MELEIPRWKSQRAALTQVLSRLLRERREQLGLPAKALALRAAIAEGHVRLLERGARQPTLTVFIQLAQALQLTPTELLAQLLEKMTNQLPSGMPDA